jgi:prevent-host-death family protein
MKKASLTETKNRLSALIDEVREGETILVLDRGRPVARIESAVGNVPGSPGKLERLERKGLVRRAASSTPEAVLRTRPPRAREGASALRELLAERSSER